jgi:CTP synthase
MRLGGFDVLLTPGSIAARLFGDAKRIRLRFRHRYEVNPQYVETLERRGMVFSGRSPTQPIMHVLELPPDRHPFFLATQAHPELTSRPLRPQPMFVGLVRAALQYSGIILPCGVESGPIAAHPDGSSSPGCSVSADTPATSV